MPEQVSIEDVKKEHELLFKKAIQAGALPRKKNGSGLQPKDVDKLIDQIEAVSKTVRSFDDFQWLSDVALQWQVKYATMFNLPKIINVSPPEMGTLSQPSEGVAFSEAEIEGWLGMIAGIRAHSRMKYSGCISNTEEMKMDWRYAEAFFASEVLEGRINFASRIGRDSYWRLENEWLRYVKFVRAYFNWEKRRYKIEPEMVTEDYSEACQHLRDLLLNHGMKASPPEFGRTRAYIEETYLTNGRIDEEKNRSAHDLIRRKADRIWGVSRVSDERQNWLDARGYVTMFYENIIPAVMEQDEKAKTERTRVVLKAFEANVQRQLWITNVFEAAIAIYFLNPQIVSEIQGQGIGFVF